MDEIEKKIREVFSEYNFRDSVEIGNSKTGSVKVYFDASNLDDAKTRISNAIKLLLENRNKILNQ